MVLTRIKRGRAGRGRHGGALTPPEKTKKKNDTTENLPRLWTTLPGDGFFSPHVRNIELSGVETQTESPDHSAKAFWLQDVGKGLRLFSASRRWPGPNPARGHHSVAWMFGRNLPVLPGFFVGPRRWVKKTRFSEKRGSAKKGKDGEIPRF